MAKGFFMLLNYREDPWKAEILEHTHKTLYYHKTKAWISKNQLKLFLSINSFNFETHGKSHEKWIKSEHYPL